MNSEEKLRIARKQILEPTSFQILQKRERHLQNMIRNIEERIILLTITLQDFKRKLSEVKEGKKGV